MVSAASVFSAVQAAAAWRSIASSRVWRTNRPSMILVAEIFAMKLPCCGKTSISPSCARRINASRTGVRDTLVCLQIPFSLIGAPGFNRRSRMAERNASHT